MTSLSPPYLRVEQRLGSSPERFKESVDAFARGREMLDRDATAQHLRDPGVHRSPRRPRR
ncbi:MAG: hypothetical protein WB761_26810 [Solirubrobacteraceae bacterium]